MATTVENLHLLLARVQRNRESARPATGVPVLQEQVVAKMGQVSPVTEQDFLAETPSLPSDLQRKPAPARPSGAPTSELWPAFAEKDADAIFAPTAAAADAPANRDTFARLLERSLSLRAR